MKKRTQDQMMDLIFSIADRLGTVSAIAMNGSRANANAPKDQFQDFDIVYFVPDEAMKELIEKPEWIDTFGERIILQTPESFSSSEHSLNGRYTFLMLFTDGNRIDLMLCPLSKISEWYEDDPVGKVLYDPQELIHQTLETTDQRYWVKEPDQQTFEECCNQFWWVSTYVVKGICRGEFFYASDHFYQYVCQELLKLVSWQAGEDNHYHISVGKNYKYLFNYTDTELTAVLKSLLDLSSLGAIAGALLKAQTLFSRLAKDYAEAKGFVYNLTEDESVQTYTRKLLS